MSYGYVSFISVCCPTMCIQQPVTSIGLDCCLRILVALKMCFLVEKCFLTFHLVPLSCCLWCIYLHFREKRGTVSQSSAEILVHKCETFVSHVCFLTVTNKEVTFATYGFIFYAADCFGCLFFIYFLFFYWFFLNDCFDCLTRTLWWFHYKRKENTTKFVSRWILY